MTRQPALPASSESPRILIARLSAVGDCILTMPLLCALRDAFPNAYLGWLVERGAAPLLENHPALNRLITVDKGWLKSPQQAWRLRRALRDLKFDTAIDPQSLAKSSAAAFLSGAPRRIGFAPPLGRESAPWLNVKQVAPQTRHIVPRQLELLRPLGVESPNVRFDVPVDEAADQWADEFIQNSHLAGGFAVVNAGAGWDSKLWPAERFGKAARHMGEQHGLPSVVAWAGPRERVWMETIVAAASGHALPAPDTTLPQLAALLRRARLFVGSDTGPLHLAAAVDTPCVALFGPTLPEDCGPWGERHIVVQKRHEPGMRKASDRAMRAIDVESVGAACDEILAADSQARAA